MDPKRSVSRAAALLPLVAAALLPKCPMCLAAWLSALGAGASVAHGAAPLVIRLARVLLVAAVAWWSTRLLLRVWKRRLPRS
jgi:hypothetical protein